MKISGSIIHCTIWWYSWKKRSILMKKHIVGAFGVFLVFGIAALFTTCLNPVDFVPDNNGNTNVIGTIDTTDVTSAVLLLTNRSKTVDVTRVSITQPEWTQPVGNANAQPPSITFANQPKRLERKAQYLTPSDKNYQVVIDYTFDAWNGMPAGTGTRALMVPLPLPKQIVEYVIYRNTNGDVLIDIEAMDPDPADIGNPSEDLLLGEGSSPAVIPPENRNKMGTLIVVNKSPVQVIDGVDFRMGGSDYTIGSIGASDKQSIALGQGSWATRLTYTRDGVEKILGPINSVIVPSNDPQAIKEHYLYFYLNNRGEYAISPEWPPYPNDAVEEDLLPRDSGYGRGLIKIVNNSTALAGMVIIHNLKDVSRFPFAIDYDSFTPPVPIQYNKTGYVDVIGTEEFPIEAHEGYLIQVTLENSEGVGMVERKAYIKDQMVTIVIAADDLSFNNAQGAKVTLENKTSNWPVEITNLIVQNKLVDYQNSYFSISSWIPQGTIGSGKSAVQYVMSTTAMPITPDAQFDAIVVIQGNGITRVLTKNFDPAVLYSVYPPDRNTRTITITDTDVPDDIRDALRGAKVTLVNNVKSWPVEVIGMTVRNKARKFESSYYDSNTWKPNVSISNDRSAVQMVFHSAVMPIIPGDEFEALVVLHGSGETATITKNFTPAELYSVNIAERNTRTITVEDSDVPDSIKDAYIHTRGAKVILRNDVTNWPIQITGMTVRNRTSPSQNSYHDPSTWEPKNPINNGNSAVQTVMSSVAMPIMPNAEFEAELTLFGNGKTATITKVFDPAVLYSDETPAQNIRTIVIKNSDVPSSIQTPPVPPPDNTRGATVTLENKVSSWPVQITGMTVRNRANNSERTYYDCTNWTPNGPIDKNRSATQKVLSSSVMPINSGVSFEAVITLYGGFTYATVIKPFSPAELYSSLPPEQNFRTITINDGDVPDEIKDAHVYTRGAKVTLENNVSAKWPILITGMTVRNKAKTSEKTDYDSTNWEPNGLMANGSKAIQMVRSTVAMPIKPGTAFEARITLFGNGQSVTITKDFNPAVLYSELTPEQNTRTITITDSDIPIGLQTVPPYDTEIPGLDGSTDKGDTVIIDGYPWYVADKKVMDDKTYVMLVCKIVMEYGVVFNDPRNSNYDGSNLQTKMTELYNRMNQMKKIAVIPNLGDHSQPYATQPTTDMAGTVIRNVFFALTYRDVLNLGDQAHRYGETHWWTRSPITTETAWEVNPHGVIGSVVTNATALGAVPGVWVRTK
jgi:hypothetical protein